MESWCNMNMLATLIGASGGAAPKTYVDDVFSAYTYTGNSSTQVINNGIDLAGKGGLVWIKGRASATSNFLFDNLRGVTQELNTDNTQASATLGSSVTAFNSDGFTMGGAAGINTNTGVSWTFRKASKFFDVVFYTGNGANRTIAHGLGVVPGMIILKPTSLAANWIIYHRSLGATKWLEFTTGAEQTAASIFNNTEPTASVFSLGTSSAANGSGNSHIAYVFAHDASADGLIQCGSFTTDGSGNATVSLGWEPQYLLVKGSSTSGSWRIYDTTRGMTADKVNAYLYADTASIEGSESRFAPIATGFTGGTGVASQTYIYMAIRRPNKPPTSATQVYNAIARTGTGAAATITGVGFAPDLVFAENRNGGQNWDWCDRLRGRTNYLQSNATNAESTGSTTTQDVTSFNMDGISVGTGSNSNININGGLMINQLFKRAPGVFDEVCYTGTGAVVSENHNLGVVPEFMIIKSRSNTFSWTVYSANMGVSKHILLESSAAEVSGSSLWNSTLPTSTQFTHSGHNNVGNTANNYVAYLFATKAGISKVGSYTGNGTTQTIDCGFAAGARFVLIKRTDAVGDWYIWDSTRGIVAGNDPHLSLNTAVAEVTTDDSIDPASSGFIVNQLAATNINVNAATYIFLAMA